LIWFLRGKSRRGRLTGDGAGLKDG